MLQNYRNLQIWNTSVFSPSVSPNFFTLFLDSFLGLLCFRFRLTGVSSIILFRARTLVVLRHDVLANWLVECFSLVVPNMVLSKLNIPKLVSQHTRGRYTFQPLWVSGIRAYYMTPCDTYTRWPESVWVRVSDRFFKIFQYWGGCRSNSTHNLTELTIPEGRVI